MNLRREQRGSPRASDAGPASRPAPHDSQLMPHCMAADAVVRTLKSNSARGLSHAEAQSRRERYGPNELTRAPETPWWKRLVEQFKSFLIIILLVAIVISIAEWVFQDPRETALPYEAIAITLIVLLNAILGFVQESRAEQSVRALMALAAPEATVLRDGERQRVAARDIVPGDIVLVEAGDKIPADARLVEVANLQTDEAALTGESMPVAKDPLPVGPDTTLGDRLNMLFAGTIATYGRARAVVVATGTQTEMGRIAGFLEAAEKEATPLQQELDRTGKRLSAVMLAICAVVFTAGLAQRCHPDDQCHSQPVPVCGCAGGRSDPRSIARYCDHWPQPRRSADGRGQRHCPEAAGDRNARRHHGDLFGQDRHAHPQ